VSLLQVSGPQLTLRYAAADDAPALFALASDPEVTRFFSWGPYERVEETLAWIDGLPAKRAAGELLELAIVHPRHGPIGATALSELSIRDRRATVGTWIGRAHWGSGANAESKALIAALAFGALGLDRLTAYASTANARSQTALERVGFAREGVLRHFHRHPGAVHDVVVSSMLREEWEASPLAAVPAQVTGEPPAAFVAAGRPAGASRRG